MTDIVPGKIKWISAASPTTDEAKLYYENTDIEDIDRRWENMIEDAQVGDVFLLYFSFVS